MFFSCRITEVEHSFHEKKISVSNHLYNVLVIYENKMCMNIVNTTKNNHYFVLLIFIILSCSNPLFCLAEILIKFGTNNHYD